MTQPRTANTLEVQRRQAGAWQKHLIVLACDSYRFHARQLPTASVVMR